jgi:hypothetical protein
MDITRQLTEVASHGGFFAIVVGGDPYGWRDIRTCYADGCADLVAATNHGYACADARVGASLVQMSLASRLWSPVLACAVSHGVVPNLTRLQRGEDSAALRLPDASGSVLDGDVCETLYRIVVEEHLEALASGLPVKIAPGLLYGNIASALVAATRALYASRPELRDDATRLARALLHSGKLAGTGTMTSDPAFRRRSCCLYYRVADGATCDDCCLSGGRQR